MKQQLQKFTFCDPAETGVTLVIVMAAAAVFRVHNTSCFDDHF